MTAKTRVKLPPPRLDGPMSVEAAFQARTTSRTLSPKPLGMSDVSQLLWSLQGITHKELSWDKTLYYRASPSSGGTFPLEVYLLLTTGFYYYESLDHELELVSDEDLRIPLSEVAYAEFNQEAIRIAPLTIILVINSERAIKITPLLEDVVRFIHLEAGHATQNLALQAASLGLGLTTMTSFQVGKVYTILKLPIEHRPIYLLPIGHIPEDEP